MRFGRLRRLARAVPVYARLAWWGLVSPRLERRALLVVQAVVRSEAGVLLTVRSDLRGWELPGGNLHPGEAELEALAREVEEETGVRIEVERRVGDYVRSGFLPHRARVFAARPVGGAPRPSSETPRVRWFPPDRIPSTLFPWYRQPLADALAALPEPVVRREHQGLRAILAGFGIDLRMRWSGDRAL